MTDTDRILHALALMQKDIHSLQDGQMALRGDVKSLQEGQHTLDLKVEVFHSEQTKANQEVLAPSLSLVRLMLKIPSSGLRG